MASRIMKEIDLVLIGKTGNGKSGTGNSILKRKAFTSTPALTSVTTEAACEWSKYKQRIIKVVDTPGVSDTRMDKEMAADLVISAVEKAIALNPRGYHAFLLVVRFGGRFTNEDVQTIEFLKLIFGKSFVRKFCILVMTYGDNFEDDAEETGKTFKEWCEEQEGVFKTLYNECEGRAILLNNREKDDSKKNAQIDSLLELIDSQWTPGHRYRDENFKKAAEAREHYLVEATEPQIRDEMMRDISLILQGIEEILLTPLEERAQPFKDLLNQATTLHEDIKGKDKGTGALHRLLGTVESTKHRLEDEIKFCDRMGKEKAEMERKHQEAMERLERKLQGLQQADIEAKKAQELKGMKEMMDKKMRQMQDRFESESQLDMKRLMESYRDVRNESQAGIVEQTVSVIGAPIRAAAKGVDWVFGNIFK